LRNENNEYFGEQVTLNIIVNSKKDNKIEEKVKCLTENLKDILEKSENIYKNGIAHLKPEEYLKQHRTMMMVMKTTYSLEGLSDLVILNALDRANGDVEKALGLLF